ncbi:unnamed protein product [Tenebrio molitor]|nr:unnamed protein product [Tenebrio molitor]
MIVFSSDLFSLSKRGKVIRVEKRGDFIEIDRFSSDSAQKK